MAAADVSCSTCRTVTAFVTTATSTDRTPGSFFRQFSITGTSMGQQMPPQYSLVVLSESSSTCEQLGSWASDKRARRSPPVGLTGLQQGRTQLTPRHACASDTTAAKGPWDTNWTALPSDFPLGVTAWWSSPSKRKS